MGRLTHFKGRIKRWLGDVTGDRRVEAVGDIELSGHEPRDEEETHEEIEAVRYEHGDRQ